MSKVQFGLRNVHYAVLTESESAAPSWGTPKSVPGAVSLTMDVNTAETDFYADDILYYADFANNGYTGTLTMAAFTDEMYKDIWGDTEDSTDKVLTEKATATSKNFALLFEIQGDQGARMYVAYNVNASRPSFSGQTVNESGKVPQPQQLSFKAMPLSDPTGAMQGVVTARTKDDTPDTVKNAWYTAVYQK